MTHKKITTIIGEITPLLYTLIRILVPIFIVIIFLFCGVDKGVEAIIVIAIISLIHPMVLPIYSLSSTKIMTYTISIILLISTMYSIKSDVAFTKQVMELKNTLFCKAINENRNTTGVKDTNGTK